MTGATYGAVSIAEADGTSLSEFVTVGIDEANRREMGASNDRDEPGPLISEPLPPRMPRRAGQPDSVGSPLRSAPMTSFLGIPVGSPEEAFGNLYLTEKAGWSEFTEDDEGLVTALAEAAGVAIQTARLHQHVQKAALYADRDRIAHALQDCIIQRLFAVGLSLQGLAGRPMAPEVTARVGRAITDLDRTIDDVRYSVFDLETAMTGRGLRAQILEVAREVTRATGFEIPVVFDSPFGGSIEPELSETALVVVREVLANACRADVTQVRMRVQLADATVCVIDEGTWPPLAPATNGHGTLTNGHEPATNGHGLATIEEKAVGRENGGAVVVERSGGGTMLTWTSSVGR